MPHTRSTGVPSRLAAVVALVAALLAAVAGLATPAHAQTSATWVAPAPAGSDTNPGTEAAPFATLQKALDVARPGVTINLKKGTYKQAVITKVAGTAAAPITVKGPSTGRTDATLVSPGGRAFSINHSYYRLEGFTIDGQPNIARSEYPTAPTLSGISTFKGSVQAKAVNSKLIYVGAGTTADTFDIVGTTITNMFLTGSGGECVRFRNRATQGLVENSTIQWCGMLGLGNGTSQYKYHNAEGVYIGTSPKSTDQPLAANDSSNNIVVRNSTINTYGSECFEVKENAHHNRMENVDCGYNDEPSTFQGSNVELRGDHNTVLGSRLYQSRSWNMKLASDSATYDRGGNTARGSTFSGAATYAIINRQTGSGPFCGNTITGPVSDPSANGVGTPTAPCAGATVPAVTARTPATGATGVALGSNVTATFSEDVQLVSGTTFTLKAGTTAVAATVTYDAATRTATLDPAADLAANTAYTATLTGGSSAIRSASGTPLPNTSWTFTTLAPADTAAPTVTARTPASGATGVAVGSNVTATFSEAVRSVSGTTFTLTAGTTSVAATVTYDPATRVATLDPTANLAASTSYTAALTGGITDGAGNPLAPVSWSFTTAAPAPADTTAPRVSARTPGSGATGVSRTGNVAVTFSEAVQGVGGTTFVLRTSGGSTVTATVIRNGTTNQWVLDPSATLSSRTTYRVTLTGGATAIRDAAGNPLATTSWTFTTGR